jgi:hypothetical protein
MPKILRIAVFTLIALFPFLTSAQTVSRWALGRPSLLMDMPADPSAGGVAWAERSGFSIFPSSWASEAGGLRIEVARIYTAKDPAGLFAEVAPKIGGQLSTISKGKISGREFVSYGSGDRTVMVMGPDGGVNAAASWIVVATYKDATSRDLAAQIFSTIKVEREGSRHWAIRSLGHTFLAAEMPFDLQPAESSNAGMTRYESSFDGMNIQAQIETPDAGNVFNIDSNLKNILEAEKSRPGVTEFTSSASKYKLGSRDGYLVTKQFKRGYRSYRVYEFVFLEKRNAVTATIQIDPNRKDHQDIVERILRTMRDTVNSIQGWNTYAVGKEGLYVDLPAAPKPPRQLNAVTIYEAGLPLATVEIREVPVGFPGAHDPDFSAKQYFEMQTALESNTKYEMQGIDRLLIDGLEARLVKAKWKQGDRQNFRRILTIYGYGTQWIIDMLATTDTELLMERVMQSVRVRVPTPPAMTRQSFGSMGASIALSNRVQPKITESASDPQFAREEIALTQEGSNILAVYEMVFKVDPPPFTKERGTFYFNSFIGGIGKSLNMQITPTLRDAFPINIDGIEGMHLIFDLKSPGLGNAVVQGDFIMLFQDRKLWTMTLLTKYEKGIEARLNRGRILNSLRVGI